ncbi:metallo-beta-lactamase superfamily protein [Trichomonas vaginalis G3]|uniref:Metallo-beta-lactamase superfamily protein n=2 Tax=Trichomonas vaginalis (strain ATCC PRA-98 / G3) TaxID=412133 RepID=A2F3K6_TRIV3|nr:metallo-beta-lactamase superfamily protein [Trichomonas vaginalis G3]|eukprot:XP_001313458.1 metallo-beta-lactamase superfamily protein [Trichomonas vaginalis G3]
MKVTWIGDNATERILPLSLFKDVPEEIIKECHIENGIQSSFSAFLVELSDITILIDTGLGVPDSLLIPKLKQLNYTPDDIKYIYITHFHGDHIGGLMRNGERVFKNATLYICKAEYDGWMNYPEEKKAQSVKTTEAYKDQIHFFNYGDVLPGGVKTLDCSGHTPGQTLYEIGGALFCADLLHGVALQKNHPEFCASYDANPTNSVAKRKQFIQYAKENHLVLYGCHFPDPGYIEF